MSDLHLGRGWRFPIRPDALGGLSYSEGAENIEHCIEALVLTRLGERVMRPDVGTEAPQMVFAPGSARNLRLLERSLREAIVQWEPRVDAVEVRAEVDPLDETRVTIGLSYVVRSTLTSRTQVFPFYLDNGGV